MKCYLYYIIIYTIYIYYIYLYIVYIIYSIYNSSPAYINNIYTIYIIYSIYTDGAYTIAIYITFQFVLFMYNYVIYNIMYIIMEILYTPLWNYVHNYIHNCEYNYIYRELFYIPYLWLTYLNLILHNEIVIVILIKLTFRICTTVNSVLSFFFSKVWSLCYLSLNCGDGSHVWKLKCMIHTKSGFMCRVEEYLFP